MQPTIADLTPRRVPQLTPIAALKALLTSSDPRVLTALFERIDLDRDGMITADELAAFVSQVNREGEGEGEREGGRERERERELYRCCPRLA